MYTGREIAIFSDVHGLYEPLAAVLEDINNRGITEIYSLGDNIGVGPNPSEVMNLLDEYNVKSIAGNSEDYITLGSEPFWQYFNSFKEGSRLWTKSKLTKEQIGKIELYPHSIELLLGGKKLALCHFANDVRFDYMNGSTWTYQANFDSGNAYKQFLHTNSNTQLEEIKDNIQKYGNVPEMGGYISADKEPLFNGHSVSFYDAIVQGHVHFKLYEKGGNTDFYTLRGVGLGYSETDDVNMASYVILKERTDEKGFDVEEVLVKYNRARMIASIFNSDNTDYTIRTFTKMR